MAATRYYANFVDELLIGRTVLADKNANNNDDDDDDHGNNIRVRTHGSFEYYRLNYPQESLIPYKKNVDFRADFAFHIITSNA
uniref:Uncharacterized protein n=1 Tax=Romanomermis culicivorax TaxID=13658 RepID=A0A915I5X6_ROMCU